LPLLLLTAFLGRWDDCDDHKGWGRLLQFLAPITTAAAPPS
jgi:hypothetical protein